MNSDHQCEEEDICAGLQVMLDLDLIRPLCRQHSDEKLRHLLQSHAPVIAAHMVSAGITAAVRLFNNGGGPA